MWKYRGQERPPFAKRPEPGEESVWDYPRPPRIVPDARLVEVRLGEILIAYSRRTVRVLETASPPTFYIHPADVEMQTLVPTAGASYCEWKGRARYVSLAAAPGGRPVGWTYADPVAGFDQIRDFLSFYPGLVECFVDGERVQPQPGGFYGGWLTSEIVGPVKGEPGTGDW